MPDPIRSKPPAASQPASPEDQDEPEQVDPNEPAGEGAVTSPRVDPNAPLPEIVYDLGKLPEPVRRMHDLIVEACKSGDIEKLRPLIGTGDAMTQLSLTDIDGDPIAFLKGLSGDTGRPGNPGHHGRGAERRLSSISMPARRKNSMSGRISSPCRSTSSTPGSASSCSRS